jgi:hypothetical protein
LPNENGAHRRQSLKRKSHSLLLGMQSSPKQWQAVKVEWLNDVGRFFVELNAMAY